MKRALWTLRAALLASFLCTFAIGQQYLAATYDGNGTGYIQMPHDDSLVPATGFTVEAWVYATGFNAQHCAVIRKNSAFLNESYNLRVTGGQPEFIFKTAANQTQFVYSSMQLPIGSWHHLAGTFDNTIAKFYFDGVLVGMSSPMTGPLLNTGGTLKIGNGDSEPWKGSIDAVRIWSVARTQQQIQATKPYQVEDLPGLVSSWHLDGNFLDSTGSNHGTMVGTVPFGPGAPLIPVLGAPVLAGLGAPLIYQIANQTPSLPYLMDVSITGTSPGITLGPGLVVPLNPPLLNYDTGASLTNLFVDFFGILNGSGQASPRINVPGDPALTGLVVSAAYVVLDPASPSLVAFISPAAQTTIGGFAPAIATITPQVGPTTGGTLVTITGAHFQAGATVSFGSAPATGVNVSGSTQITCTSPAGTLGPKNVTVTNPDGFTATVPNGFTYATPLVLTQVTPVVAATGALVSVQGSGIQPGATLSVGGIAVPPTSTTPTLITFTNPAGVPCDAAIVVTNPNGLSASRPFNPSPSVVFMVPSSGTSAGGNAISIIGQNFWPGMTVTVNGNAASFTTMGSTSLSVTMPAGTPGPAQVVLTSANGCSTSVSYTYL